MGRGKGKLKLELMSNLKARCRYFEKRKKSVDKSAKDLSTLCGVEIGMIFYSPDLHGGNLTTPTTWSSQPGALAALIASFLASGPQNKACNASDCLKEKMMEPEEGRAIVVEEGKSDRAMEEEGKLDQAMEEEGDSDRAMEEELDRAGLVAKIGEERGEITESSSAPVVVVDQESWTYEQLLAANFDCYSDPATTMMINNGGDLDSSSNGGGVCAYADPFETPLGSSYDFGSEFFDLDSCFSSGGQSIISPEANWFLNEEQSGGERFMMSPCVLAS